MIKLESLKLMDSARGLGDSAVKGMAGLFTYTGRGKQSIIIDVKTPEGREAFERLVKEVDVVIQNFRPGTVQRMGIAYEDCVKLNPNIIYFSGSGFGFGDAQLSHSRV